MTVKEKAAKMRSMSDNDLVAYVGNRVEKARSEGFNQGKSLKQKDIDNLTISVVDMRDYIIDISPAIKYDYSDNLLDLIDDIHTLTTKLNRR